MKLSEFMHLLQRYHDLYPGMDPEVIMTAIDYCPSDQNKQNPEYNCHTCDIKLFETRTLVHIPSNSLFSERGPYLNIFYEKEFIDTIEDFWKNNYFQQHGQKQTGSTHSGSCSPATTGTELGGQPVPPKAQGAPGVQ